MRKKLQSLTKNLENRELIIHSLIALFFRGGGAVVSFAMNIVVARYIGAAQSGYFFLAIAAVTLLAMIARIGADNLVLRFISVHYQRKEFGEMNSVFNYILKWVSVITVIATIIACFFSKYIALYVFNKDQMTWPLLFAILSIPCFALYNVIAMALQAIRKVWYSISVLKILSPLIVIIMVIFLRPKSGSQVTIYYTVSCVLTAAIGYGLWRINIPCVKIKNYDFKPVLSACYPLWIVSVMQQVVFWGGQLIAGAYVSPVELAQLAAARNTALLVTFILTAINYVSAPRFASMYKEGKLKQLENYAKNTTRLMTFIATPILIGICIFPSFIMGLFGKEFHGGTGLLCVLAAGQYISVITGSVQYLLMMSGHEKDLRNITIINGLLAIVLAFVLTYYFGAMGSAISSAVAVAASNLMALGLVKKRLGFTTLKIW